MGEVVSRERLMELVRQARESGRSIALAAGVFDPFHVGHVRYLQACAGEADVLAVAIHDPVAAEGGPVILAAEHRADLVAAIRWVDAVMVLDGPVASLVDGLKPDVCCQDVRDAGETATAANVKSYGGRVAIVGDPDGPSTEDVLARIAAGGTTRTSAP